MVEHENEAVRDRLGDLERKVHIQNDEIVCLKATLADCLRRLNTLEVDKVRSSLSPLNKLNHFNEQDHVEICTTPTRNVSQASVNTLNTNGFSKIPLRRPMSAATARDRRISHGSDTGDRPGTGGVVRRAGMYNSNTSINSDVPQTPPMRPSSRVSTTATPRLFTPSSNAGSSQHRKIAGSMGKLHKKWRSTSDFDPSPALSVYRKNTATGGSSLRNLEFKEHFNGYIKLN